VPRTYVQGLAFVDEGRILRFGSGTDAFLEDHAVRHSYHHFARIRAALEAFSR